MARFGPYHNNGENKAVDSPWWGMHNLALLTT